MLFLVWVSLAEATAPPADPDWPLASDWVPVTANGASIVDDGNDAAFELGQEDDELQTLGDALAPALLWAATPDDLFFRLQVGTEDDPTILSSWNIGVATDRDDETWEVLFQATGSSASPTLTAYTNETGSAGLWVGSDDLDAGENLAATGEGDARRLETPDVPSLRYVDVRVARAWLMTELGVDAASPFRIFGATTTLVDFAASETTAWLDVAGCDDGGVGGAGCAQVLDDTLSDPLTIDGDMDGLTASEEAAAGTDPTDADSDDDGLADGEEQHGWATDPLACDTDGDGLPDGLEAGVQTAGPDTVGSCFVPDLDATTTTDPLSTDSDEGCLLEDACLLDGEEDRNGNGRVDDLETDPNDASDDGDLDGDGVADVFDDQFGVGEDLDSDGDGIVDAVESLDDPDEDGIPNFGDTDSDNDGVPDALEGAVDTDGDGAADFVDLDSDGDGIADADESGVDADCDGVTDRIDTVDDDLCDGDGGVDGTATSDSDGSSPGATDAAFDPFADEGTFGGGRSCSTAGGAGAPLWAFVLAAAALFRRGGWMLWIPGVAGAQEIDAQRFAPSVDGGELISVEDAAVGEDLSGGLGLWLDHADDPLVFRDPTDIETPLLDSVTSLRVTGHVFLGRFRVGADVPLHVNAEGFGLDGAAYLGDVRLSSKARVWSSGLWGVAPTLDIVLPTGDGSAWLGTGEASAKLGGALDFRKGRWMAAVNTGLQTGTGQSLQALDLGPAWQWGVGASYAISDGSLVAAEIEGEHFVGNGGVAGRTPAEGIVSFRQTVAGVGVARVGIGTALASGVGAPDYRLIAGLAWRPKNRDAVAPANNAAPAVGHVVVRAARPTGEPLAGAQVRIVGTLGRALRTGDDGILEAKLKPGSYEAVVVAPGWHAASREFEVGRTGVRDITIVLYPDEVVIDRDAKRVFPKDNIYFEVDVADLKPESMETLDDLAEALMAHPELGDIRIEGHTDSTGSQSHNFRLSQARAQRVRDYLVAKGVAADRLDATGVGELNPLHDGDTDDAHAANRRVEFHIAEL